MMKQHNFILARGVSTQDTSMSWHRHIPLITTESFSAVPLWIMTAHTFVSRARYLVFHS